MLTPDQISELHRLHWVEKWSLRKIARHLRIGRRTLAKYLNTPALKPARRERSHKIEPWKAAITELLEKDPEASAPVIAQHLKPLGHDGGLTIIKDYLRSLRKNSIARRAYVRVEPAPGERFDVDWGHFGALVYNGATRKLYAFCLVEAHSRKMYLEFTHSQTCETFARCHLHAFQFFGGQRQFIHAVFGIAA
jgi:transposase